MQRQGKGGGPLGALQDPTTGQPVQATVMMDFTYTATQPGDPTQESQYISQALTRAISTTLAQKLSQGQLALPTINHSMPALVPEIVQASGLAAQFQILALQATVQLPQAPAPAAPAVMPPTPEQATAAAFQQAAQDRVEALDPRNYEYEAQVNVGGFKLKGSTDGGFDTDGLKDQIKDKAKSNLIWYGAGCFILLLVLIGLAILGWYIYAEWQSAASGATPERASGSAEAVSWDGTSTYQCGAGDNVMIANVTSKLTKGTGVKALGGCVVTLKNVTLEAPTALEAIGNSKIIVQGGSVTGSKLAAYAMGKGEIVFQGTTVTGETKTLGAGAKITGP